jgi:hypothetical protein
MQAGALLEALAVIFGGVSLMGWGLWYITFDTIRRGNLGFFIICFGIVVLFCGLNLLLAT